MYRKQVPAALVLVAVGAVVAVDGPEGVRRAWDLAVAHAGLVILAVGLVALISSVAPRGAIRGPLAVTLVGGAILGAQRGMWSVDAAWRFLGVGALIIGGVMALGGVREPTSTPDPIWRRTALLFRRRIRMAETVRTPSQLRVTAIGSRVTIDLRQGNEPLTPVIEVAISCWAARVELKLPDHWAAVAGRIHSTPAISLLGRLDTPEPCHDIHDPGRIEQLQKIAEQRARVVGQRGGAGPPIVVVVHVIGYGGAVALVGRE